MSASASRRSSSARAPRPAVEEPSLLVCHEKHGNAYFYVPDEAALFEAALKILEGRHKAGYFYADPESGRPADPGVTRAQVEAMGQGHVRQEALKALQRHDDDVRWWKHLKEQWAEIQRALKERDGRLAWRLLRERSDHEYENVSVERLCKEYRA